MKRSRGRAIVGPVSDRKRVLIAGGGVAGLEAMLTLHELATDWVELELIAPEPRHWYRALAVAEPFGLGEVRSFDLSEVAGSLGALFVHGELVAVDAVRRLAQTADGASYEYDALLLACGGLPRGVVPGALTFRGPADTTLIAQLLRELDAGTAAHVVVAVPFGVHWPLPAYELSLLIANYAEAAGLVDVEVTLVTPEDRPLMLFGEAVGDVVSGLLAERSIAFRHGTCAIAFDGEELRLTRGTTLPADCVIALPRLYGRPIEGIPQTRSGFVAVDAHGRVDGLPNVYAAGDVTTFPLKQGGIAAQQADAAAEAIAAWAGADVDPRPFRPVVRGLLLTGREPQFLRRDVGRAANATASVEPLWWPPAKIVGRRLAPFLVGIADPRAAVPEPEQAIEVHVELEPDGDDFKTLRRVGLGF